MARVKQMESQKPRCHQVLSVKMPCDNGGMEEFATKLGVYAEVKANLSNRFWLAFTASSCFGFLGDIESVQQILKGTYILFRMEQTRQLDYS